jgi:chemosensory pili system protein ChpA (sensor histidine kinase/response regulator)
MVESGDQEFLRSIFLMEAWDTLIAMEDSVGRLGNGGDEPGWDELLIVTHRLKGAASLQGFARVASLAETMEHTLRPLRTAPEAQRALVLPRVTELLTVLKTTLEAIERGAEPSAPVAPVPAPVSRAEPRPAAPPPRVAPPRAAAGDPLRAELATFFQANDDVLSYFGPEASEHLEAMTTAILMLEHEGASDGGIAALFRAVHTLKGAAYVVGCRPIGELAHELEDLLVTVREGRAALTPAMLDASLASVDCLKRMLDPSGEPELDLTSAVSGARARVATLLAAPASGATTAESSGTAQAGDGTPSVSVVPDTVAEALAPP